MKSSRYFLLAALLSALLSAACGPATKPAGQAASAASNIGIVTGGSGQAPDEFAGAVRLVKDYGDVLTGGRIHHVPLTDIFGTDSEKLILTLTTLADEPGIKAIIVNQAGSGTTEAFRRIREKHPETLLLAGEPTEDPLAIQSTADLAVNIDFVARGYLLLWSAKQMGAKAFVHLSFPRHMAWETVARRRAVMEQAAKDLGLTFIQETISDPAGPDGVSGADKSLAAKVTALTEKYGKDTAFFTTAEAQNAVLIKAVAAAGAYFVEAALPRPETDFVKAFDLDISKERGDYPAVLKKIEAYLKDKTLNGRFGTWAMDFGYANSAALGELARRVLDGQAKVTATADILDCYNKYSQGAKWNGWTFTDPATRAVARNHVLLWQDTWVLGRGSLGSAQQTVPDLYSTLR